MKSNGCSKDYRGWWFPGVANFFPISFLIYAWFDSYSSYNGWPFWWRVITLSLICGGGVFLYAYSAQGDKSKACFEEYVENAKTRIKGFWLVLLLFFLFFQMMPGRVIKSDCGGNRENYDPGEWSRP